MTPGNTHDIAPYQDFGDAFTDAIVRRDSAHALSLDQDRAIPTWAKAVFFNGLSKEDQQWFLSLPPCPSPPPSR